MPRRFLVTGVSMLTPASSSFLALSTIGMLCLSCRILHRVLERHLDELHRRA